MKRGYMDWNKTLLPQEALVSRRDALSRELKEAGIACAVVYGDVNAADELIDYTNYGPYWCNTAAIITAEGGYHLVTGHNARVNPWICQITGVEESQITPAGMKVPQKTAEILKTMLPAGAKVGIVGKYTMADAVKALREAGFEVVSLAAYTDGLMQLRDESYRGIVTKGHEIMESAIEKTLARAGEFPTVKQFCAALEYALRSSGAMDVVVLASVDGCAFSLPYEERAECWNLFVNVQYLGQWLVFALPVGGNRSALDGALEEARRQLKTGGVPEAHVEGFEITVKTHVLSDQISSLNVNSPFLAKDQVVTIAAFQKETGIYGEKMYCLNTEEAAAFGRL